MKERDYMHRQGRVLADGSNFNPTRLVQVVGTYVTVEVSGGSASVSMPEILATGGVWRLKYNGKPSAELNWDCAASDVQTALEALDAIGPGEVTVTGGPFPDTAFSIVFDNADLDLGNLTAQYGKLEAYGELDFDTDIYPVGTEVAVSIMKYDAVAQEFQTTHESLLVVTTSPHWAIALRGEIHKSGEKWWLGNLHSIIESTTNDDLRAPPSSGADDDGTPGEFFGIEFTSGWGLTGQGHARLDTTISIPEIGDVALGDGVVNLLAYPVNGVWICTPKECY